MPEKKVKEKKKCPQCHGRGWMHVYSLLAENPCPLCNKTGKVTQRQYDNYMKNKEKDEIDF